MPLRYAYGKNNNNSNTVCNTDVVLRHDNVLRLCWIIFVLRHRQKCRKLECVTIFIVAVSVGLKTQRGAYTSSILTFSAWLAVRNNTILFLQRHLLFSIKTSDVFTFYIVWERGKAALNSIWPVRLKRISRNAIWIGFQTTYECSLKRICTNRSDLSKYDWISIGFAQKSDLGWQSERGFGVCNPMWRHIGISTRDESCLLAPLPS